MKPQKIGVKRKNICKKNPPALLKSQKTTRKKLEKKHTHTHLFFGESLCWDVLGRKL